MGVANFDPRGTGPLLLALASVVAFWFYWVPALGGVYAYPELRLEEPTKALLQDSLVARASTARGGPPSFDCQLCDADGTRRAWRELETLYDSYDEPQPFVKRGLAGLERAKAISLAAWGDPQSLQVVPEPRRALASLDGALAGVRQVRPERVQRVDWLTLGLEALAVLLAPVLFWRWRRLVVPLRPWAFGAGQGALLFLWSQGAIALLFGMLGSSSLRDLAADLYPLPELLVTAAIASVAFEPGSWLSLARHFGFVGVEWRPIVAFAMIALGGSLGVSGGLVVGGWALGHVTSWADVSGALLIYGSDADKLLRWLSLVVVGPFYEELAFTGLLFGSLVQRFSFRASALTTGIVFAGYHAYDLLGSLDLLLGSMLSCWAYFRTRSLWPSVLVHGTLNAAYAAVVFY
jgi:membrane protease YdiL (CAAX protease family)